MAFEIILDKRAVKDIEDAARYYERKQKGLSKQFIKDIDASFSSLSKNPFFQVRYDDVRCLPLKKFPFMVHFVVDEKVKEVIVYAIIHTSLDPDVKWIR